MRALAKLALAGAALLAPAISAAATAPASAVAERGDGSVAGGSAARFGTVSRAQATAMTTAALGAPVNQGSHGDCGQGDVIGYAKFRGGLELSFVKGKLSGWTADNASTKTAEGIGVGATLAALRRAYPDVEADPGDEAHGGLGPSFQREAGPNGWLDGVKPTSKVTGLYAGATCLAGI